MSRFQRNFEARTAFAIFVLLKKSPSFDIWVLACVFWASFLVSFHWLYQCFENSVCAKMSKFISLEMSWLETVFFKTWFANSNMLRQESEMLCIPDFERLFIRDMNGHLFACFATTWSKVVPGNFGREKQMRATVLIICLADSDQAQLSEAWLVFALQFLMT